jgi:hypothetical protein
MPDPDSMDTTAQAAAQAATVQTQRKYGGAIQYPQPIGRRRLDRTNESTGEIERGPWEQMTGRQIPRSQF